MYTIDSTDDQISQFKLTTPYDVSTLSLEGTFDVSSVGTEPRQIAFSHDGSKMFLIGNTNNKVFEFNLSCNWSVIDGACDDPVNTSDKGSMATPDIWVFPEITCTTELRTFGITLSSVGVDVGVGTGRGVAVGVGVGTGVAVGTGVGEGVGEGMGVAVGAASAVA